MANSYKPGKWSGTLEADVQGDSTKSTPTLGDDYDTELKNLKTAQKNIKTTITAIKKQITALKNHSETGKMATSYLEKTEKRLTKISDELDNSVTTLSNAVTKAQKEEWQRYKKLLDEWAATQNSN
jgi:predicted  nucleic acid-binding Zn-ribbon protein